MSDPKVNTQSPVQKVPASPGANDFPYKVARKIEIALDGQQLGKVLNVDSSCLMSELEVVGAAGSRITVAVENGSVYEIYTFDIPQDGMASIPFAEIMRYIPLGSRVDVTFYSGNNTLKKISVERSDEGLAPDPARIDREIIPLYQGIAEDLQAGRPLVIETHVVLWDSSFTGAGAGKKWAVGNDPKNNLYWGAGNGVYQTFKRDPKWKLVKDDEKLAVFKRTIKPSQNLKTMGVDKPFEVYAVFHLHYSEDITEGYRQFARDIYDPEVETISLDDGSRIEAGSRSRVVGFIGHMHLPEGQDAILDEKFAPPVIKKGVFMTTCYSAQSFADAVVDENVYPLLFNTRTIAAEGYTFPPFFEKLINGAGGKELLSGARSGYRSHQKSAPADLFVNSVRGLSQFLFPFEGDEDGDEIINRIDPEPHEQNPHEKANNMMLITTSDGQCLEIFQP